MGNSNRQGVRDVSSLPQPVLPVAAEVDLSRTSEAAWVIDLDEMRVVAASPTGGALWGSSWRQGAPLDRAMPAVQDLIHVASRAKAGAGGHEAAAELPCTLLVWTVKGSIRLQCRCRLLSSSGRRVLVTATHEGATDATEDVAESRVRATLAHELRTPLSAIMALAEVMKEERLGPMGNPRYLSYSRDIHESARHALSVLAAMMGSEPEARSPQDAGHADVDEAVEKSLSVMRELARLASVRLETDLVAGHPQVSADSRSLMQILINLLSNALKFTPPGGVVTVQTRRAPDGGLTLSVTDTGTGMSRRSLEGSAAGPGSDEVGSRRTTGHGLPIVRSLAQASGARVDIASAPGEGTRVSITFPPDRVHHLGRTAA